MEITSWPAATTCPTSSVTFVTTPPLDARRTVYITWLRASSSLRASASAAARAVSNVLCACSSSNSLTEPSSFSPCMRCQSDSACRARVIRRFQLLAGGFFRESIVGVVEHGEHIALAHALADVDPTLEDLAADAECLIHFVPRLHGAEVATHLARTLVLKLD